jgi:hypothetical protein
VDLQTHRQHGDDISLFLFFQNKGSMLKIVSEFELQIFLHWKASAFLFPLSYGLDKPGIEDRFPAAARDMSHLQRPSRL